MAEARRAEGWAGRHQLLTDAHCFWCISQPLWGDLVSFLFLYDLGPVTSTLPLCFLLHQTGLQLSVRDVAGSAQPLPRSRVCRRNRVPGSRTGLSQRRESLRPGLRPSHLQGMGAQLICPPCLLLPKAPSIPRPPPLCAPGQASLAISHPVVSLSLLLHLPSEGSSEVGVCVCEYTSVSGGVDEGRCGYVRVGVCVCILRCGSHEGIIAQGMCDKEQSDKEQSWGSISLVN